MLKTLQNFIHYIILYLVLFLTYQYSIWKMLEIKLILIKEPQRLLIEQSIMSPDNAHECSAISSSRCSMIYLLEPSPWPTLLMEDFWRPLGYHMCFSSFNDFAVVRMISMRHCWENNSIYYLSQFSCCCI